MSSRSTSPGAAAIIVAAGAGRRFGADVPKQYLELGGEPVLLHALRPFLAHPRIASVVVVLPAADAADPPSWIGALPVHIAAGGDTRGESVANGLAVLPREADPVLIHDGARPLVSVETLERVLDAARRGPVLAAVRVADTLKEVGEDGTVLRTLDRDRFRHAHTPQGFPREMIVEVNRRALADGIAATDDAALCEHYGYPVTVVEDSPDNIKITHPVDLLLAEQLLRRRSDG